MILLQEPFISEQIDCPYISGEKCRYNYFFALELDGEELDQILQSGWRKFGAYYFRPYCPACRRCVPLRVLTGEFRPTKSQRRVMRKCADITVKFGPLEFNDRIFEIYQNHTRVRFGREAEYDDFVTSFYTKSCPSMQSEYYLGEKLIALGFLDCASDSLSSAYFIYDTAYSHYRLGTYSVLKEIEYAGSRNLSYYYLGYWIEESISMAYKNRFSPHELYDWQENIWSRSNFKL